MAEVNKETFLHSISSETELSKDFFMKIYGYSLYDRGFETTVIVKLKDLELGEVITGYEEWKKVYEAEQSVEDKTVAHWYIKECEKQWDKLKKEIYERAVEECREEQVKLLLKRKYLLSLMKQMSS